MQRVLKAAVQLGGGETVGEIGRGILLFLGVGQDDSREDVGYLAEKVVHLRIFPDDEGKMNLSLLDVGGAILVVSQFTLLGDCRKGRRPSYAGAAAPEKALQLYEAFLKELKSTVPTVASGRFQEMMHVQLVNDGPVTLLLDSRKQF